MKYKIIKGTCLTGILLGILSMAYSTALTKPKPPVGYRTYTSERSDVKYLTNLQEELDRNLSKMNLNLEKEVILQELEGAIKTKKMTIAQIEEIPEIRNYQKKEKSSRRRKLLTDGGGFLSLLLGGFGWIWADNRQRRMKESEKFLL